MLFLSILSLIYPAAVPVSSPIDKRGFVSQTITKDQILTEFIKFEANSTSRILSPGSKRQSLTFVTPWNPQGYDLALQHGSKFSTVVPIWFTLQLNNLKSLVFTGLDSVNDTWIKEMRVQHPHVTIAPRIFIEIPSNVLTEKYSVIIKEITSKLEDFVSEYDIKCIFLECPALLFEDGIVKKMTKDIRKMMQGGKIIISLPSPLNLPNRYETSFKPFFDHADLVFVTVYEMSQFSAISPKEVLDETFKWVEAQSKKAVSKSIFGLPFFGFDFFLGKRDYVFGQDFLDMMENNQVIIKWLSNLAEHAFFFTNSSVSHTVHYPTPMFLDDRIQEIITRKAAGVGFWEISHGLPCFFDLL